MSETKAKQRKSDEAAAAATAAAAPIEEKIESDDQPEPEPKTARSARSCAEIIADLSKPLPRRHLKMRKQGGTEITYIEWHTAVKYLDYFAPGWSYHVQMIEAIGNLVAVVASISIPCQEGTVTREATGCEDLDNRGYGDACSNAEAMALKRAAAKFGLGLYLYEKGNHSEGRGSESRSSAPADPKPKTLDDIVTPKQLWAIRKMAQEIGCDVDAECRRKFDGLSLEEISKRAASSLIDHLKALGEAHAQASVPAA